VNLRTGKPSVRALRNAILEVLRNESYRNKAQEIGRDFASRDALKESVCLIEQALPAA
jgi:UDP:flavonoid glycosyltransferase YjiC (YdhE family)